MDVVCSVKGVSLLINAKDGEMWLKALFPLHLDKTFCSHILGIRVVKVWGVFFVFVLFLQDDKKFYQLELVNRETGFNKVFNSSANVGVINPLIKVSGLIPKSPVDDHRVGIYDIISHSWGLSGLSFNNTQTGEITKPPTHSNKCRRGLCSPCHK